MRTDGNEMRDWRICGVYKGAWFLGVEITKAKNLGHVAQSAKTTEFEALVSIITCYLIYMTQLGFLRFQVPSLLGHRCKTVRDSFLDSNC
jgi:hypothetical protein